MNKAFQKKWVKALRSGEYKQIKGMLSGGGGYCCLGVARHLIDPESIDSFGDCGGELCGNHAEYVGLTFADQNELARLNDNGFSFYEISYLIENL